MTPSYPWKWSINEKHQLNGASSGNVGHTNQAKEDVPYDSTKKSKLPPIRALIY